MNKHRREMVRATRTPTGALASLAAAAFAVAVGGCTRRRSIRLSTKTGAGERRAQEPEGATRGAARGERGAQSEHDVLDDELPDDDVTDSHRVLPAGL